MSPGSASFHAVMSGQKRVDRLRESLGYRRHAIFDDNGSRGPGRHCFAEGTSRHEIVAPCFFQPSRKSHVRGRYTRSGS